MKEKGGLGIFGVIVLVVIIFGVLAYFIFFRDIRAISGYAYEIPNFNTNEICDYYGGYEGDICVRATDSVIYYKEGKINGDETNDVILFMITKGLSEHKSMLKSSCSVGSECNHIRNVFISYPSGPERPAFSWYYSNEEFIRIKQWGDGISAENSKVIERYLKKYPPIQI
jgi:hypothetical protein